MTQPSILIATEPATDLMIVEAMAVALENYIVGAEFIWDSRWKPIFPPQPYWYLYRRP